MATQQRAPCLGSGERSAAAGVQREQRGMSLLGAHTLESREGTRASRRVEEVSSGFSPSAKLLPWVPFFWRRE